MLSAARPRLRGNIPTARNLTFLLTVGACFGFIFSNYLRYIFPPLCSCPQSQNLSKLYYNLGTVGVGVNKKGSQQNRNTQLSGTTITDDRKNKTATVRVLCWVITRPQNRERVRAVRQTWGKRCDKLIFMSSKNDSNTALGVIALENTEEGRDWLWGKSRKAMKYIWKHHKDDADWFLKADDDTYVILDNLRYFLADKGANYPIYYGHGFNLKGVAKQGYMSGGAAYVMSREAIRRFVEVGLPNPALCNIEDNSESKDAEVGTCLENVGVEAGDSRDDLGRQRFLPFYPRNHLRPGEVDPDFLDTEYSKHPVRRGRNTLCSNRAISFQYISAKNMHAFDYFVNDFVKSKLNSRAT